MFSFRFIISFLFSFLSTCLPRCVVKLVWRAITLDIPRIKRAGGSDAHRAMVGKVGNPSPCHDQRTCLALIIFRVYLAVCSCSSPQPGTHFVTNTRDVSIFKHFLLPRKRCSTTTALRHTLLGFFFYIRKMNSLFELYFVRSHIHKPLQCGRSHQKKRNHLREIKCIQ